MALESSPHVQRLRRFQPWHPDSGELIYEQSDPNERLFRMAALHYLEGVLENAAARLVVLTGDAGHGKTSLCAEVLRGYGQDPLEVANSIRARGDASAPIGETRSGRHIWLLSDLSNLDVAAGAEVLCQLLEPPDHGVAIVCANEGRLRGAVACDATGATRVITRTLEQGISDGTVSSISPAIHVINLNFQSATPDDGQGVIDWALKAWVVDRRRWQACGRCDAQVVCPIVTNHRALSEKGRGSVRRRGIGDVFRAAERSGRVIPTRQALAIVAHAVTGGLTCTEVHRRYERDTTDHTWQYPYLFHQAIFADRLSRQDRGHVPAYQSVRSLDPGRVALREVDDTLEPDVAATVFLPPVPSMDDETPRSRRDANKESQVVRELITFLRRAAFFEAEPESRLERMDLRAGPFFVAAAQPQSRPSVEVRDKLLRGLEAIQGVYRSPETPDFLVLDPAFFSNRSRAAVIAARIPGRNVELVSQLEQWRLVAGGDPQLPAAVDWASRLVFLRLSAGGRTVPIPLDLLRFELLHRWAAGLSSRVQHEAELRSLTGALSALAPDRAADDDIGVLVGSERRTLTIDVGDRIRSGGV